jgi:2-polyprenyl-3-methyl-5-hydroxy-6-metoxy-1,4-benzoquinol methylase
MFKKLLLKYNYPQVVFGRRTKMQLENSGKELKLVIDCPCGNGETAWHLSKLPGVRIIAADISETAIHKAKQNFPALNIDFRINTIEAILGSEKQFDAFCIVNSLFLLDNYDTILSQLKSSASVNKAEIVIIIPNTEGKNFKWFQLQGTNENKLIIKESEIGSFFSKYNFKVKAIKPVCFTHHYGRSDVKLFSIFWSLYLGFLNRIQTTLKIGKPNYFLIALSA